MKQKGGTLLEVVCVMALMGTLFVATCMSSRMVEKIRFDAKVYEVVSCIEFAKQSAIMTGKQYGLLSYEGNVYCLHKARCIKKVALDDKMRIPHDITGQWLWFNGSIAPRKAGTILIKDSELGVCARITVGVGTGMVRVYYEKC